MSEFKYQLKFQVDDDDIKEYDTVLRIELPDTEISEERFYDLLFQTAIQAIEAYLSIKASEHFINAELIELTPHAISVDWEDDY